MFACLAACLATCGDAQGAEIETAQLVQLASDFSPRYEVVRRDLVMVEIGGLQRIFGTPRETGEAMDDLARQRRMSIAIGIAATRTAALLLAVHLRSGGRVVLAPDAPDAEMSASASEAAPVAGDIAGRPVTASRLAVIRMGQEAAALAALPLSMLAELPGADEASGVPGASVWSAGDVEPLRPGVRRAGRPHARGGQQYPGFNYRLAPVPRWPASEAESASASAVKPQKSAASRAGRVASADGTVSADGRLTGGREKKVSPPEPGSWLASLDIVRRWGLRTLGELARLPAADVFQRLGAMGWALQQHARGQDERPLVPSTSEEPFEASLALEWPVETIEPLSFVLGRLLDPLCLRLERRDRGVVAVEMMLQLVTKDCDTRRLELPAPMRDPKVLRTLLMLNLESHPPSAGIDRVSLFLTPTPSRIVQHSLLVRALPAPEQLSTLTARLAAIMGDGRCGAPALVDSYRPEAFEMRRFQPAEVVTPPPAAPGVPAASAVSTVSAVLPGYALRRFRRPVAVSVQMEADRPVRVTIHNASLQGGRVEQAAGPWRTSGEWWLARQGPLDQRGPLDRQRPWDRDEWDVALSDGGIYRIHHDRLQNRWYLEGILD